MAINKTALGLAFVFISLVTAVYPLFLLPVLVIAACLFLSDIPLSRITHFLFYVILVSAILGPYLSVPGLSGLFLFRIAILLHFFLFLFEKKDLAQFALLKLPLAGFALWILFAVITLIWSQDPQLSVRAIYFQLESFILFFFAFIMCEKYLI
ncbi:hypothetical protein [Listeria fleischmannii]|uniref:Uncharacterized protein n=1 Tax=Listeria fleischmannii FSL S10-1203 TaxID=1265822 RepID=W7DRA1_9LIST|nr:hypothetical protein [Listeria fleischmannii]EUJ47851.1 hypothetical protein MCOL2_17777 [Listeria fleischmannii FSL S10-1203]